HANLFEDCAESVSATAVGAAWTRKTKPRRPYREDRSWKMADCGLIKRRSYLIKLCAQRKTQITVIRKSMASGSPVAPLNFFSLRAISSDTRTWLVGCYPALPSW